MRGVYLLRNFVRAILGDGYVDMTERNIAGGDPFGVYKQENEFIMFVSIAWNNIFVTLLLFSSGIFLGIGTIYFLLKNGLMLGVFEYMFFHHHLGGQKNYRLILYLDTIKSNQLKKCLL